MNKSKTGIISSGMAVLLYDSYGDAGKPPAVTTSGLTRKFQEAFGERVKARRREQRLTQLALARRLYVSRAKLANIEAGSQRTSVFLLARLAQILEVPAAELIPEISEVEKLLAQDKAVTLRSRTPPAMLAKELEELNLSVVTDSTPKRVLKRAKAKK